MNFNRVVSSPFAIAMVAIVVACTGQARADREAVESVIKTMERAVLDADQDTYLKQVSRANPFFFTEQTAWASDLEENTPEEFRITILEEQDQLPRGPVNRGLVPMPGAGEFDADIELRWRLQDADQRSVRFRAKFRIENEQWKYAGMIWRRVGNENTVVLHAPGDEHLAIELLSAMPAVREHVDGGFDVDNSKAMVEVKLYQSMRLLQQSINLSYTAPLGGWNEPGEAIKIVVNKRADARALLPALAHEYGHNASFALGPKSNDIPWWALEGIAELASERWQPRLRARYDRMVKRWADDGTLVPLRDIADFPSTPINQHGFVYAQGYHMVGFISDRWGRDGRNAWFRAMANGASVDQATQKVMQMPFDQLEQDWHTSLSSAAPKIEEPASNTVDH